MRTKLFFVGGAAALALVVLAGLRLRAPQVVSKFPSAAPEPTAAHPPPAAALRPPAPRPPSRPDTDPADVAVAGASFAAVFPTLPGRPANWHEFNRRENSLTVAVHPDLSLTFQREYLKEDGGYATWVGRVPGWRDATAIATATPHGTYDVLVNLPGTGEFTVHTDRAGQTFIRESELTGVDCGSDPAASTHALATLAHRPLQLASKTALAAAPYAAPDSVAAPASPDASPTTAAQPEPPKNTFAGRYVDVLFLYDPQSLDPNELQTSLLFRNRGVPADIPAFLDGMSHNQIEMGNVVLANSGVLDLQWRHVGLIQCPDFQFSPGTSGNGPLTAIGPQGVLGAWTARRAAEAGADAVHLYIGSRHGTQDTWGGLAWGAGRPQPVGTARSVSVVNAAWTVTIHELAHVIGANHDRATAQKLEGDGYGYGMFWRDPTPFAETVTIAANSKREDFFNGATVWTQPDGKTVLTYWRYAPYADPSVIVTNADGTRTATTHNYWTAITIMAYGADILPYFSNPDLVIDVDATTLTTGNPHIARNIGRRALGVPVSDPAAANNARLLRENGPVLSDNHPEIQVAPTIIRHPTGGSFAAGQSMTLTVAVNAAGSYQWLKDGTPIRHATSDTYTRELTTADAGAYSVIVSNRHGSATSNSATISVQSNGGTPPPSNPPPNSPAPTPGSGGGGGGGGAPSLYFLVLTAALASSRLLRPAKR